MPILYSGSADTQLVETLHQELLVLHADRSWLYGHPSLLDLGDAAGSGSDKQKVALAGLGGYNSMAPVAENTAVGDTPLAQSNVTCTIARQAIQRNLSDLKGIIDSVGINVPMLAQDGFQSAYKRFNQMLATTVGAGFTDTVGAVANPLTATVFQQAGFKLTENSVGGPYLAFLYPKQVTGLQASLRSSGLGPGQYVPATQEMLAVKGAGFVGSYLGVDIFSSADVEANGAGTGSEGAIWGVGAVGYRHGSFTAIPGTNVIFSEPSPAFCEIERDSSKAMTAITHNYYVGLTIIEGSLGVNVTTIR